MKIKTSWIVIITFGCIFLLSSAASVLAARPVITSHTPQYSNGALIVTVQWQSDNPVMKATLLAGSEQKSIKLDDENRRIPAGYHGEGVISTQIQGVSASSVIVYALQIEDEYRQKSELIQGRFILPVQAAVTGAPTGGGTTGDNWGMLQERIKLPPTQQSQAAQSTAQPAAVPQLDVMHQPLLPADQAGVSQGQTAMPSGVIQPGVVLGSMTQYPAQQTQQQQVPISAQPPVGQPMQQQSLPQQQQVTIPEVIPPQTPIQQQTQDSQQSIPALQAATPEAPPPVAPQQQVTEQVANQPQIAGQSIPGL